jgi:hypothetical protein
MKIQTSIGEIAIKAANLPNFRLIVKRNKGKRVLSIAQKKPLFYIYKHKAKKGKGRANIKVRIKISDSSPIYGISQLLNLFQ